MQIFPQNECKQKHTEFPFTWSCNVHMNSLSIAFYWLKLNEETWKLILKRSEIEMITVNDGNCDDQVPSKVEETSKRYLLTSIGRIHCIIFGHKFLCFASKSMAYIRREWIKAEPWFCFCGNSTQQINHWNHNWKNPLSNLPWISGIFVLFREL